MTETMVSPVETALENQRIGSLQIRVVALCGLVQICDAFDVNSIGIVVPSLTHEAVGIERDREFVAIAPAFAKIPDVAGLEPAVVGSPPVADR